MKKLVVTGIVAVGVLIGGTTFVGASMNDSNNAIVKADTSEQVVKSKEAAETKVLLSMEEVKDLALSEYDGHIESIDLENEDGYTFFEVEMDNGKIDEIYIEAYTGEVLKVDMDDDYEEYQALENIISADQAKKIALDKFGGKVRELELDEDDNRYEYEIELRTEQGEVELTIDAVTGDILEQELDD